ncbi:MAG: hypothetical protein R2874_04785 [Desulfobacterales bacterium]
MTHEKNNDSVYGGGIFYDDLRAGGFCRIQAAASVAGVAIGLGAAILGNAILNSDRYDAPPEPVVVDRDCRRPRYCDRDYRQGYWEVRKIWVEPVCERVWNPGHYNRHSQWVPGQYVTIEKAPGYWEQHRVWVGCR